MPDRSSSSPAKLNAGQSDTLRQWAGPQQTQFTLRPVQPEDVVLFLQMLQDLSPGSAYFRFGRHDLVDLSEDRILAICNPDPTRMVHFVVKATTGCGTRLAGNARYEIETAGQAEFVILVADPWQNCGVGRCLMQALIERASRDGLHSLHAQVLPSNRPMQQFLMKMGFEIERDSGKQPLRFIKKLI